MCAGEKLSYYWPQVGMRRLEEKLEDHIMKVKYNSCGSALYSACDGGAIKRYNRHAFNKETLSSHAHYLEGEVYRHKSEIWDFDISRNDDCKQQFEIRIYYIKINFYFMNYFHVKKLFKIKNWIVLNC